MTDFFKPIDCDERGSFAGGPCLSLTRANALLKERGERVYGGDKRIYDGSFENPFDAGPRGSHDTHQALLISVEPIAPADTAEDLLSLACRLFDYQPSDKAKAKFLEHANRLLSEKGGER